MFNQQEELPAAINDINNNNNDDYKSSLIEELCNIPNNNVCVDCKDTNPGWINIMYGIFCCDECSIVHRKFVDKKYVVEKNKLNSLPLSRESLVSMMMSIGNMTSNYVYGTHTTLNGKESNSFERENFIKKKYVEKENLGVNLEFLNLSQDEKNAGLFDVCATSYDIIDVIGFIAIGANINWQNESDQLMSPLHVAIERNWIECVEYLLLQGGHANLVDKDGNDCFFYASIRDNQDMLDILNMHAGQGQLTSKASNPEITHTLYKTFSHGDDNILKKGYLEKKDFLKNKPRFFVLKKGGEMEVYKTEMNYIEREAPLYRTLCSKLKIRIISEKDNVFAFCHSIKDDKLQVLAPDHNEMMNWIHLSVIEGATSDYCINVCR